MIRKKQGPVRAAARPAFGAALPAAWMLALLVAAPSARPAGGSPSSPGDREQESHAAVTVVDGTGREVTVPPHPGRVICSGSGCLRLLVYLRAQDRVVAVDDMEKQRPRFEARPYALANPGFRDLPLSGEFRGHDNPELIVALDPPPQVIFKTYPQMGHDPGELQRKTGIPVVALHYGDLTRNREVLYASLRLMARILGTEDRAEQVISYLEAAIQDLNRRSAEVPDSQKKSCYVGGIAFKGPHGLRSTEPNYPPFLFTGARNPAHDPGGPLGELAHAVVAKEKILQWDPEYLFIDLSTLQAGAGSGVLHELRTDPVYRSLRAVKQGNLFGVFPYNWYTLNFGSTLANAYFIGTVLYPDRFADVDPQEKADDIYRFLVGEAVFERMNGMFGNLAFRRLGPEQLAPDEIREE